MPSSLNFTGLDATLRTHIEIHPELLSRLLSEVPGIGRYTTKLSGIKDAMPIGELLLTDLIQPGNKDTFNDANDTINFKNRTLTVRPGKVDLTLTPTKLVQMHKSFLSVLQDKKLDYESYPFEQFILDQLSKKVQRNINTAALKGTWNAAGTGVLDVMDGFITIIGTAITAGKIPAGNVLARVTIDNTNAVDTFGALAAKVPAEYWEEEMVLIADPLLVRAYDEDYRASFGALPYNTEFKKRMLDGYNIEITPETSLSGTGHMFISMRENLFYGYDDDPATAAFRVEYSKRFIYLMLDFQAGVEIGIAELVWPMALTA